MQKELMITEDGSHTIYLPEMDEHYHSTHGAIQESLHIYIEQGLLQLSLKEISILEIGFGTGLNAYLTFCYAKKNGLKVNYYSLEKYPLQVDEYSKLNYTKTIFPELSSVFDQMHRANWGANIEISPDFMLHKINADLVNYSFETIDPVHLVFFDAFAPSKQPEMWSDEILERVAKVVWKDGILVTYCAKGTVRRAFSAAGFEMERIPGPIGKKEILRGKKKF